MHFVITQGESGNFFWHIKTQTGEIISRSGPYSTRDAVLEDIKMLKLAASRASVYDHTGAE